MKPKREASLDKQVEWFHAFAELSLEALAAQASEANRLAITDFVTRCLPQHPFPPNLPSGEFAGAVQQLRRNEQEWNQALCSALIEADELFRSMEVRAAASTLESFARSCPWEPFSEVARNQARQYRRG